MDAEWLARCVDEDEAAAGEPRTWKVRHHDCCVPGWDPCEVPCPLAAECAEGRCDHRVIEGSDGMVIYDEGGHDAADAAHIARNDPARALREVELKRAILDLWEDPAAVRDLPDGVHDGRDPDEVEAEVAVAEAIDALLRLLAEVYSDRPGYEEAVR